MDHYEVARRAESFFDSQVSYFSSLLQLNILMDITYPVGILNGNSS